MTAHASVVGTTETHCISFAHIDRWISAVHLILIFARDGCFCSSLFPWDDHSKWCKCFRTSNDSVNRQAVLLWIMSELRSVWAQCCERGILTFIPDSFLLFGDCTRPHSSWSVMKCYLSLLNISALLQYSSLVALLAVREPRSARSGRCRVLRSRLPIQWMDRLTGRSPSQVHLLALVWQSTSSKQGEMITTGLLLSLSIH